MRRDVRFLGPALVFAQVVRVGVFGVTVLNLVTMMDVWSEFGLDVIVVVSAVV